MQDTTIRKVSFIGTGIMGAPIAAHLMDAGVELTVHSRTRSKAEPLVARGARWAADVASAVRDADVVFTMLGYPEEVEEVYLARDGLISSTRPGAWMVDLTTSSPELARDIHDAAEVAGRHAFDCPVTGGEQGAVDGTLTLMAGVSPQEATAVRPLLESFSAHIHYLGGAGKGQVAKLCNQVSLGAAMVGYADALALAEREGLDKSQVIDIISQGMGGSTALRALAPKSVASDYRPGFMVEHLRKDLRLALAEADEFDVAFPSVQTAESLYDLLCKIGGARLGTQAITLLYADDATAAAAGLDWSGLDEEAEAELNDAGHGHAPHQGHEDACGCGCGDGCGCGHEHEPHEPRHQ